MTASLAASHHWARVDQLSRAGFDRWCQAQLGPLPQGPAPADPGLIGVLLTHRKCSPEHQPLVFRRCLQDRRVLPRWHQEDRGRRNTLRGHHEAAPAGAYSGITVWSGRQHWVQIVAALAVLLRPDVLGEHHVSATTFRAWAIAKSGYAQDQASGRRCIVRPDTLASVVGVDERTIQRCNAAARQLGLEVVVMEGRMLNGDERSAIRAMGSRQRGLATEVALTIPAWLRSPVDRVTPPKRLPKPKKITSPGTSVTASGQTRGTALRAGTSTRRDPDRARVRSVASELARRLPWLAGEGPGRLGPALRRFVTAELPWTAAQLTAAITRISADRGPIHAGMIRTRPAALLAALLRRLDPIDDHPGPDGPMVPPPSPPPPGPCGGPDCDGHGWINGVSAFGYRWAHPCPNCPPAIRRTDPAGPRPSPTTGDYEPPF